MKTRDIGDVRAEIKNRVANATPEELEKIWNRVFATTGNYISFNPREREYTIEKEDWSDPHWDK